MSETNSIQVTKITIVQGYGADQIAFETLLPEGCWPYQGHASVLMRVAADSAQDYCKRHFPNIVPTMINRAV